MLFCITSHRGDHQAVLEEVEVQEAVFNKLVGNRREALPSSYKLKMPDNFGELEALFQEGQMGYMATTLDEKKEPTFIRIFNPEVQEVNFLAPIVGG